jgi:hypothetical protein
MELKTEQRNGEDQRPAYGYMHIGSIIPHSIIGLKFRILAGGFTQILPYFPAHVSGFFSRAPDQEVGKRPVGGGPSPVQPAVGCLRVFRIQKGREPIPLGALTHIPEGFLKNIKVSSI